MEGLEFKKAFIAGIFSIITIGFLTLLTYKTEYGIFLIASFGSTMVLLFGYPESQFAQPKNIFFGHLLTSIVGVVFVNFIALPIFYNDTNCCRNWSFIDDFNFCYSPSCRWKPYHCYNWISIFWLYYKSNYYWKCYSFGLWSNSK